MSVLLNLDEYADEVEAFAGLAEEFVGPTSALRLNDIARELRNFVDAGAPNFVWRTSEDIVFRPSTLYDGPGRQHTETSLAIGFTSEFSRPTRTNRKCRVWAIAQCVTHLALSKDGGQLRFHIDYKNPGQWGPQLHFQVKEEPATGNLPIPRIPSVSFLPTDCADLGLAELHPLEWRRVQASRAMSHHMSVVRSAQEDRTMAYLNDIHRQWNDNRNATRICMLQNYSAKIGGLPDRHGNEATF